MSTSKRFTSNEAICWCKTSRCAFDNSRFLSDLQVAIGILNKEGADYTFPHRSLQEYFAALYIAGIGEENKQVVYSKITSALLDRKRTDFSSRDNFYLLLSELDETGIIKYIILNIFDKFLSEVDFKESDYDKIIDDFFNLKAVYDSFKNILDSTDINVAHNHILDQFAIYQENEKKENGHNYNVEIASNNSRKKVAHLDINPFFEKFLPKIRLESKRLSDYLVNENKSDTDIIDLIA